MKYPKPESCSFCGKSVAEVARLLTGPNVAICEGCIDLCAGICEEKRSKAPIPVLVDGKEIPSRIVVHHEDGTENPIDGIDLYLFGLGPFLRGGEFHKVTKANGKHQLVVNIPAREALERIGAWFDVLAGKAPKEEPK